MAENDPEILPGIENNREAYEWIKERRLLILDRKCRSCKESLILGQSGKYNYLESFKCRFCENQGERILVIDDSIFYPLNKQLTLSRCLHLVKYWCDQTSQVIAGRNVNINDKAVIGKVYKRCREFCVKYFQCNPVQLGGSRIEVAAKMYDLNFRTNQRLDKTIWILVMVCRTARENKNNGEYMQIINTEPSDHSAIIPIMENVALPGSHIACENFGNSPNVHSNKLTIINYDHDHEHQLSFYVSNQKKIFSNIKKAKEEDGDSYLKESMWRERVQGNVFNSFIEDLKNYYFVELP